MGTETTTGALSRREASATENGARRILYIASTAGHLEVFHRPHLEALRAEGIEVHTASGYSDVTDLNESQKVAARRYHRHAIPFDREPWGQRNIKAARELWSLLRRQKFAVIHCHTPTASAITRLVALFARTRAVIVYTCHGLHFYPGAPARNWVLWFTAEYMLAKVTDIFVAINRWDMNAAARWLRPPRVRYVPGVGVDTKRFYPGTVSERDRLRAALGISAEACLAVYVAEFIPRKQHEWLLSSIEPLLASRPNLELVLVGNGPLESKVSARVQASGLEGRVHLLGFRRDVAEILRAADLAVSTSRHEGLPMGVAEAMASGLPVVVSEDRGHRDLVVDEETGFVVAQRDTTALATAVQRLVDNPALRERMGAAARASVERFSLERSVAAIRAVHLEALKMYAERIKR
jgi:glycosyltransferase EpsD